VEPPSGTTDLAVIQDIEVTFNELVDPVSVPGSVVIAPELTISTRVRGRRIIIRPEEPLQEGQAYVITFQRGIRDFQRNNIPRSYQLVFSTGGDIPGGMIQGTVAEFNPQRPVEIGLFQRADTTNPYLLVQSVGLAEDGSFAFAYLPDGVYRLAAVEGGLSDFPNAIHRRPYALPAPDSLVVQHDTIVVALRLSPLLARPQIQSVDWRTATYAALTFDMPFGEAPLPANLYPTPDPTVHGYILPAIALTIDSALIDLGMGFTQLGEPYPLQPLVVPTPELVDTVPPVLTLQGRRVSLTSSQAEGADRFGHSRGRLAFSEPVRLAPDLTAHLTGRDTIDLPLEMEDPITAFLDVPDPERYHRVLILGHGITDEAGNAMADSLLTLDLRYDPPGASGQIRGRCTGFVGRLVVEARNVETGQRTRYTTTDSSGYLIARVPPGFYIVFAHEQVGSAPIPYYSGRWEPYHRAAFFGYHPDVVEVRARWEVDGIDINFGAGNSHIPPDVTMMRRE
jgi:hypothetical protein